MNSKEVLMNVIDIIKADLEELEGLEDTDFIIGERRAYEDCLVVAQNWTEADTMGLGSLIEKPLPSEPEDDKE